MDLSLAPNTAVGDSVASCPEAMGLEVNEKDMVLLQLWPLSADQVKKVVSWHAKLLVVCQVPYSVLEDEGMIAGC